MLPGLPLQVRSPSDAFFRWQHLIGPAWAGAAPWPGEGGASLRVSAPRSVFIGRRGYCGNSRKSLGFWPQEKEMEAEEADLTDGGTRGVGLRPETGSGLGRNSGAGLVPTSQTPCVGGLACPRRGSGNPTPASTGFSPRILATAGHTSGVCPPPLEAVVWGCQHHGPAGLGDRSRAWGSDTPGSSPSSARYSAWELGRPPFSPSLPLLI